MLKLSKKGKEMKGEWLQYKAVKKLHFNTLHLEAEEDNAETV